MWDWGDVGWYTACGMVHCVQGDCGHVGWYTVYRVIVGMWDGTLCTG
jgi:hypothetical protein